MKIPKLRVIDSGYNNGAMNMAIDEALLKSKIPVLRFYRWKPAALSIGYFQPITNIDLLNLKKNKIDFVRRLTGGKAVLHDDELTYSFIIDEKLMPKSVIESYKIISKPILGALNSLGLKAAMNESVKKREVSAVCFNDPSWYEIKVNDKKIVGSAQKRVDGKVLQHGAVLIDIDIKKYFSLFKSKKLDFSQAKITSIKKELKRAIGFTLIKDAMINAFRKEFDSEIIYDKLTKKEKKDAENLSKTKYSKKEWNERM